MKSVYVLSLSLISLMISGAGHAQSSIDAPSMEESIELFPLYEIDSEIDNDLKTSVEDGVPQAILVIQADTELPLVRDSLPFEIEVKN